MFGHIFLYSEDVVCWSDISENSISRCFPEEFRLGRWLRKWRRSTARATWRWARAEEVGGLAQLHPLFFCLVWLFTKKNECPKRVVSCCFFCWFLICLIFFGEGERLATISTWGGNILINVGTHLELDGSWLPCQEKQLEVGRSLEGMDWRQGHQGDNIDIDRYSREGMYLNF